MSAESPASGREKRIYMWPSGLPAPDDGGHYAIISSFQAEQILRLHRDILEAHTAVSDHQLGCLPVPPAMIKPILTPRQWSDMHWDGVTTSFTFREIPAREDNLIATGPLPPPPQAPSEFLASEGVIPLRELILHEIIPRVMLRVSVALTVATNQALAEWEEALKDIPSDYCVQPKSVPKPKLEPVVCPNCHDVLQGSVLLRICPRCHEKKVEGEKQ